MAKAASVRRYKAACFYLAKAEAAAWEAPKGRLIVTLDFRPPVRRGRDEDNLIASMKAGLDGLAQALGVDDSRFNLTIRHGPVIPGGAVHVTIEKDATP